MILNKLVTQILLLAGKDTLKKIENYASKIIGIALISGIVITISIIQYKPKMDDEYVLKTFYPVQAAEWINENLDSEKLKLYNEYNYGSYLLYKGIPVFVDSRCDLYMPEFNDNMNAFEDFLYLNGWSLKDMEAKIDKYGFTHFIVSNGSNIKKYLKYNEDKYVQIYPTGDIEDENFTIFERIK